MPQWFKNWRTPDFEFDDKNADGVIQYVADTQVNELTIDRDIMVLANPEIEFTSLGNWINSCGRTYSASTAAGLLLQFQLQSHDLEKNINPNISEKGNYGCKNFYSCSSCCCWSCRLNPPVLLQSCCFSIWFSSLFIFPCYYFRNFDKKMNKEGALCGI